MARRGVRATTSARAGMGPAVEPVEAPTREVRRSRRSSARGRWEMGARRWFVRSGTSVRTRARARRREDDGRAIDRSGGVLPYLAEGRPEGRCRRRERQGERARARETDDDASIARAASGRG
jgi:hypothetical protein